LHSSFAGSAGDDYLQPRGSRQAKAVDDSMTIKARRYLMAILLTLLFAAFLYLAHYLAEATVARFTRGQTDMNLPVPAWLQLLLSLERFLFALRFPLMGLVLVISLVAVVWSGSVLVDKKN
jgi:hypothetical protein